MYIRLAWRLTDAQENVTTGQGRWVEDCPATRKAFESLFSSLERGDSSLMIEKWIEESPQLPDQELESPTAEEEFSRLHRAGKDT